MKSPMEELGWWQPCFQTNLSSLHFLVSLFCPCTLDSNTAWPGLSWRTPISLLRNSAALTFKLEIDFWLAEVAQTLIGMIAFLVYMRQSFAFRLICSALSVALGADYMEHYQPRGWTQPYLTVLNLFAITWMVSILGLYTSPIVPC
jgi:hypothetical protein